MPKRFSYADAVRLLGAGESKLASALDRIFGGALLSGVALGLTDLLGWFDAKVDFIRYSRELLVRAAEKRSGLSRYDRTERLQAAHAVIVVVAFFEAVDELGLPVSMRKLGLARDRQLEMVGLTHLFDGFWPLPSPARPYEASLHALTYQYDQSTEALVRLLRDHAVWNELSEAEQDRLAQSERRLGGVAVRRYEELLRQLAGGYPELMFWLQVQDGLATRAALVRLETVLQDVLVGGEPDLRRAELVRKYRAVLDRPIIDPDDVLPGLRIPAMGEAYVDPDFQVISMGPDAFPAVTSWWNDLPGRDDLYRYLVGYLTSPKAIARPLLVLGDPGSGKSLLTKVLAARLPASDFLTVRVKLRSTPTEADLLEQIEHGLRAALQENLSWVELTRSAGDALPVVLLDGFDELLQATGVSQTRYLAKVEQFQRDRAETGHPVAVVVTSRISVCGGMHIPLDSDILRLVPFHKDQVTRWLEVWNRANREYFSRTRLSPLAASVVLSYPDLARQPLLLLMLALYDSMDNVLQRDRGRISEADLYERLLTTFARREVVKDDIDRSTADVDLDTERELERLSVVAFAMFNRGAQWATEMDLNEDLAGLLEVDYQDRRQGMRTPLSAGEAVLGRFFFVQRGEAVRDSRTLRAYEFLHATFGEYLVARFTWRVLCDLHQVDSSRPRRLGGGHLDDSELYALLSFTPLTSRRPVINFLIELAAASTKRVPHADLIKRLFSMSLEPHLRSHASYEPVRLALPARYATYSLNLVLLAVVVCEQIDVKTLGVDEWPRLTAFWKSQLSSGEWNTLIHTVNVRWAAGGTVVLSISNLVHVSLVDPRSIRLPTFFGEAELEPHFTADPASNLLRYPLEPVLNRRFSVAFSRALVELGMTPVENRRMRDERYLHWAGKFSGLVLNYVQLDPDVSVDVLRKLADSPLGRRGMFWAQLCDRIGRGGPNRQLLEVLGLLWQKGLGTGVAPIGILDAWLRLHEIGFEFPEERSYPDLVTLLATLDLKAIENIRPDLIRRARYAITDLGGYEAVLSQDTTVGTDAMPLRGRPTPEVRVHPQQIKAERPIPAASTSAPQDSTTWQNQLRQLDHELANGLVSPDDYRIRRDQILAVAVRPPATS